LKADGRAWRPLADEHTQKPDHDDKN